MACVELKVLARFDGLKSSRENQDGRLESAGNLFHALDPEKYSTLEARPSYIHQHGDATVIFQPSPISRRSPASLPRPFPRHSGAAIRREAIPKEHTVFRFKIPVPTGPFAEDEQSQAPETLKDLVFELHGSQFENRPADRANKKFKWKNLNYL
ncbi:hypothetical protein CIHG_07367 [Coccidioides immitis H538.4]|uniref:Uncharacterized protein n=1 Tax=Coccidioides immitis H538.4 TaxID=396776 RepID=A0A0J8RZJ1_COCIT|nr:hypothetical protein CIHG_07367 [Coccidioides immitis H538.4]